MAVDKNGVFPDGSFPFRVYPLGVWPENSISYAPVQVSEAGMSAISTTRRVYARTLSRPFAHRRIRS
jgi:hypothetical protein